MDDLGNVNVSIVIPTFNRKGKLLRLIKSLLESTFPLKASDITVVNDRSTDGTAAAVSMAFPDVELINNEEEGLISRARNIGIRASKGQYVLLIDDDNVIDRNCVQELVKTFVQDPTGTIGIVGPMMCYYSQPDLIWCAGVQRNMATSLTKFVGRGEIDSGQYRGLIDSLDFPNAFMISREVIVKVGAFDERSFPIHYEEADLGERTRRGGFKVVCNPLAKTWHDISLPSKADDKTRTHHLQNETRAYFSGRNRVIFIRKYASPLERSSFIYAFNWAMMSYYLYIIYSSKNKAWSEKARLARSYVEGVFDGMRTDPSVGKAD
jgi:GT2 family glycosyltransferase